MQNFRLVFLDADGRRVDYDLMADGCVQAITGSTLPGEQILILPAASSLPFQIELPFSDQAKIARVLPQFVADLYVDVDEKWLFSWLVLPAQAGETSYWVAGLAFPGHFNASLRAADSQIRLAVPDAVLACGQTGQAVRLKTPVSEVLAIFSGCNCVKRILSVDSGLPVEALLNGEGIESLSDVDLVADPQALRNKINGLLASENESLDMSGYRRLRNASLQKLTLAVAASVLVLLVALWHLFIWLECRITERAAQRTRSHMQRAFSAVFPGVPVVEPLIQADRSIAELEKRLKEAATVPIIPWQRVLQLLAARCGPDTAVLRLSGRTAGLKLSGIAVNYAAIEAFRNRLESSGLFEKVNTSESRQGTGGITFSLEAVWKN